MQTQDVTAGPGSRAVAVQRSLQLMHLLWPAALVTQAIGVAAKLGLADFVAHGARSAHDLAAETQTHAPSLERLLRALTTVGVFVEERTGWFGQSAFSDVLRTDHPQSVRPRALMLSTDFVWRATGQLEAAVRSGEPVFAPLFGRPFFDYMAAHGDASDIFDAGVEALPASVATLCRAYDFSRMARIVDVGGGRGALLAAILAQYPLARGVLCDLPATVARPSASLRALGARVDIVAADFFDVLPTGADCYILSRVIHDWDDAAATKILRACHRAMPAHGVLLVIDTVLTSTLVPARAFMDVLMMVLTGGRERTETELCSLVAGAELAVTRTIVTAGASIFECRPCGAPAH